MAAVSEMGWMPSVIKRRKSRPPLGLRNLGNTCYINSVLQCLTYTPPLANLCLRNHHSSLCQKLDAGGKRECPFCILEKQISRSLILEAQSDAPSKIGSCIRLFSENFQWGRQEDAHEFLRYVIDTCHDTCLKILKCGGSFTPNGDTKEGNANGHTIVREIFGGSLISQVICLACGNESKKIDDIMDISLDLFQSNSLKDALRSFFQPEVLDGDNKYNCGICKKLSSARKQMSIFHAPNVLVIQLKRFEGIHGGKINRDIAFEEILHLKGFMFKESQDFSPEYSLFGSIVHSGHSPESGHYYAYIKDPTGQWYCCNDTSVSLSTSQEVLSEKVYILFYLRKNQRPKCSNFSGNVHLQNQKTIVREDSERVVPSELKTIKTSSGLQVKLQNVKKPLKRMLATSANGNVLNKSPVMQDIKELSAPTLNGMAKVVDVYPNSNSHSSAMKFSGQKRKSSYSSNTLPDRLNDSQFIASDDQCPIGDLQSFKKLLVEQASLQLRTCGWVDEVGTFMRNRKKLWMKETGSCGDLPGLRKALIENSKYIFISQLPEALKQNLVKRLKSFSEGKMSLDA